MKPTIDSYEFQSAVSVQKMRDSDAYTIANLVSSKELMYRHPENARPGTV